MMKSLIKLSPLESSMSVIKLILGSSECFNYNNKDYSSFFFFFSFCVLCKTNIFHLNLKLNKFWKKQSKIKKKLYGIAMETQFKIN